jgi:hypothetical protein
MEINNMKNTMIALACALTAPLAFAQTSTTVTEQTATAPVTRTTETTTTAAVPVERETTTTTTAAVPVAREQTTTTTTYTDGTVSTFAPGKTIVVRRTGVTEPVSYSLGKSVRYVNRSGHEIKEQMIRPGARVHVYYDGVGQTQVVNRVVVDDD